MRFHNGDAEARRKRDEELRASVSPLWHEGIVMKKTGGEIIWECLKREGVKHIFGYPGGAILPAYDALCKYPEIHHVLVRNEQGAAHMADGYARAGGGVG